MNNKKLLYRKAELIINEYKGEKKMIKEAIVKIVNKEDLTYTEAYTVINEIMKG